MGMTGAIFGMIAPLLLAFTPMVAASYADNDCRKISARAQAVKAEAKKKPDCGRYRYILM